MKKTILLSIMIMVGIQAALGQVLDTISRTTYDRYYYDWWPN